MSTSASAVNERLAQITEAGTSIWLDQIRRTLITEGELQRLIDEDSLRGVTSNPAIFEKAILGSSDYDDTLKEGAAEGKSNVKAGVDAGGGVTINGINVNADANLLDELSRPRLLYLWRGQ